MSMPWGELGSEFHILRKTPLDDIRRVCGRRTAQAVERLRAGQVDWHPGYDGEYGHFQIFAPGELGEVEGQLSLTLEPEPALTAKEDGKKPEAAAPLAGTAGPAAKAAEPAARTPEMPAAHPGLNPAQNRALLVPLPGDCGDRRTRHRKDSDPCGQNSSFAAGSRREGR